MFNMAMWLVTTKMTKQRKQLTSWVGFHFLEDLINGCQIFILSHHSFAINKYGSVRKPCLQFRFWTPSACTDCFKCQGRDESTKGWRTEESVSEAPDTDVSRPTRGGASKGDPQKWPVRQKVSEKPKDSVPLRRECSAVSDVAERSRGRG